MEDSSTNRVMLWCIGRSLSTVFLKCMSYVKEIQILSEPFVAAYQLGPERLVSTDKGLPDASNLLNDYKAGENTLYETNLKMAVADEVCTYEWAGSALAANYPGKSVVFCKDMPFAISGKYEELLPKGFRHTFLIRHPHKVFLSWKKMVANILETPYDSVALTDDLHPTLFPPKRAYGELYDQMMFLKALGAEPTPIVIDTEDLQRNPDSILRQYFEAVGMPYDKSLLQWPTGAEAFNNWIGARTDLIGCIKPGGYQESCVKSTCFAPPSPILSRDQLDDDILVQVDYVWDWYQEMYALRIRP